MRLAFAEVFEIATFYAAVPTDSPPSLNRRESNRSRFR
jgi:hypothetical protein